MCTGSRQNAARVVPTPSAMQQPVICAICYNTVDGSDSSKPTQCGHAMHISCFKRLMLHAPCTWTVSDPCTWTVSEACKLVGHIACPMCRRQDEFRVTYPGDVVSTGDRPRGERYGAGSAVIQRQRADGDASHRRVLASITARMFEGQTRLTCGRCAPQVGHSSPSA
jgi:hypothetical protein